MSKSSDAKVGMFSRTVRGSQAVPRLLFGRPSPAIPRLFTGWAYRESQSAENNLHSVWTFDNWFRTRVRVHVTACFHVNVLPCAGSIQVFFRYGKLTEPTFTVFLCWLSRMK